jgi:hypothetical protein
MWHPFEDLVLTKASGYVASESADWSHWLMNTIGELHSSTFCTVGSTVYRYAAIRLGRHVNPLNAELNPICHLLVLLGDLTFMGPCAVSIFQYISNKMQRYTVYLYLETALHVSDVTSLIIRSAYNYLQHLVFVTPLLLSAAVVEELEPVWVCCGWRTPPTSHSNRQRSQISGRHYSNGTKDGIWVPEDGRIKRTETYRGLVVFANMF